MTLQHVWGRLIEEMNQYAATPEGKADLERITNRWLSQNS
ncbi:hypothetical protein CRENPOLYSF2_4540002 [Crenothrix polyspora]|uniref:Uncharacterized protein n=1 Tax=Crenothrix polyspora TaxID=360316 RepID=A0A1R4HFQ0_9GAMM|nr:hypothetical protein CRENPOLYSF2_4540002 [Crenothrix polyspora]